MKYTAEQIEKVFGEKLDSTNFTWQYYCGTRGVSVLTILDMETALDIFNPRFTCEGWCYGDSLLGGFSKPNGIAVMLWDKEDEERDRDRHHQLHEQHRPGSHQARTL